VREWESHRIEQDNNGAHYLQFCQEDSKNCSFAAVIFPEDLRHMATFASCKESSSKFTGHEGIQRGAEIVVSDAWH